MICTVRACKQAGSFSFGAQQSASTYCASASFRGPMISIGLDLLKVILYFFVVGFVFVFAVRCCCCFFVVVDTLSNFK